MTINPTVTSGSTVTLILPFANYWMYSDGATAQGTSLNCTVDMYSLCSSIFAFSRGGVRLNFLPTTNSSTQHTYITADHVNKTAGALATVYTATTQSQAKFYWASLLQPYGHWSNTFTASFFVPQNTHNLHRLSVWNYMTINNTLTYSGSAEPDPTQIFLWEGGASDITFTVFRAGADDCSFHRFVSIPPMVVPVAPA